MHNILVAVSGFVGDIWGFENIQGAVELGSSDFYE